MNSYETLREALLFRSDKFFKVKTFYNLAVVWMALLIFANFSGTLLSSLYGISAKQILKNIGILSIAQPKIYTEALWLYVWAIKFVSSLIVYFNKVDWNFYRKSIYSDVLQNILFVIEYGIVLLINQYIGFKISGHGLILSMSTNFIWRESDLNYLLTSNKPMKIVCFCFALLNFYIFFWTAFAFHTLPEGFSGLLLGLITSYLVYIKSY